MAPPRIVTTTIQSAVLSATSNILAQLLKSYRSGDSFALDTTPIVNFVVFTLLSTPPNFLWQEFLEESFPAYTVSPIVIEPNDDKGKELVVQRTLNKRNTAIKFLLDQTIGALINTILFLGGMAYLKGANSDVAVATVKRDTFPLMIAGYKLWPIVSLLSFTVIPAQQRLLFGSLVGVAWGIFLSLFASH